MVHEKNVETFGFTHSMTTWRHAGKNFWQPAMSNPQSLIFFDSKTHFSCTCMSYPWLAIFFCLHVVQTSSARFSYNASRKLGLQGTLSLVIALFDLFLCTCTYPMHIPTYTHFLELPCLFFHTSKFVDMCAIEYQSMSHCHS